MADSALLSIDAARLLREDLVQTSVSSSAESSLALLGQWHAVFQCLAGEIPVRPGALCVAGDDARGRVTRGEMGLLVAGFKWPAGYTVQELLDLSARLLGYSQTESTAETARVLQMFDLGSLRKQKLSKLLPVQERLVSIAHAMIGSPQILAIEEPLLGLTSQDSMAIVKALGIARVGRKLILSVSHAASGSVERVLVDSCAEVIVLQNKVLTLQGPPARLADTEQLFVATFLGQGNNLQAALTEQGIAVRSCSPLAHGNSAPLPLTRAVIELAPGQSSKPLFAAAQSCSAPLLELHAISDVE